MPAYLNLKYNILVGAVGLKESPALLLPSEMRLQALWFAGQMGREFTTSEGQKVKIIQFGHWNHSSGPDFLNAAVEIDSSVHAGAIELECNSTDWENHGHATNSAFDKVVLHVVFSTEEKERFTRTSENKQVPRIIVPEEITRQALNAPLIAMAPAHQGRCFQPLSQMSDIDVNHLMMEAARHRVQQKATRRKLTIDALGEDEWLWQALAETLGYRPNKLPMTLLAQRLPIKLLREHDAESESLIFGSAGYLSAELHDHAEGDTREYLRHLWETWWRVRSRFEPAKERQIPWTLSGVRPVNHPQRRLAALAQIASRWDEFSKKYHQGSVTDFIQSLEHSYWNYHYTVSSKRSKKKLSLIGADRVNDFEINQLLPIRLAADEKSAWESYLKIPAPTLSEKVNKASIRLFGNTPKRKIYLRKAWQHQALLQIYQDFCLQDVSDCEQCPFPEQLSQWQK
ncbi:MAG: DUF2851 family protein [Akkermansiaceae bacterium]